MVLCQCRACVSLIIQFKHITHCFDLVHMQFQIITRGQRESLFQLQDENENFSYSISHIETRHDFFTLNPRLLHEIEKISVIETRSRLSISSVRSSTYYWTNTTYHLFRYTPVLNTGLSLSEPLQIYQRQSLDSSASYMYTLWVQQDITARQCKIVQQDITARQCKVVQDSER